MIEPIINKNLLAFIDRRFYWHKILKQAAEDKRSLQDTKGVTTGGNGHMVVSDPTAKLAIKHIEHLDYVVIRSERTLVKVRDPEQWVSIYERIYNKYKGVDVGEILHRRYEVCENPLDTMADLLITNAEYYRLRNIALSDAAMIAVAISVIKL